MATNRNTNRRTKIGLISKVNTMADLHNSWQCSTNNTLSSLAEVVIMFFQDKLNEGKNIHVLKITADLICS